MTFASRVASSGVIWGRLRRDPIDPGGGAGFARFARLAVRQPTCQLKSASRLRRRANG